MRGFSGRIRKISDTPAVQSLIDSRLHTVTAEALSARLVRPLAAICRDVFSHHAERGPAENQFLIDADLQRKAVLVLVAVGNALYRSMHDLERAKHRGRCANRGLGEIVEAHRDRATGY